MIQRSKVAVRCIQPRVGGFRRLNTMTLQADVDCGMH